MVSIRLLIIVQLFFFVYAEQECTPGKTFKMDCNTCSCTPQGKVGACTKMACPAKIDQECTPGRPFKLECNTCFCTEQGKIGACTEMACSAKFDQECTPGQSFQNDCNRCSCTPQGKVGICTQMACVKKPGKVCNRGDFEVGHSKCVCNDEENDFNCTKTTGPPAGTISPLVNIYVSDDKSMMEIQNSCTQYFNSGCHVCKCNSDHQTAVCSILSCMDFTRRRKRDVHSDLCTSCYYTHHGMRCTRSCGDWRKCEANARFKIGCNNCTCNENGSDYTCTNDNCSSENNINEIPKRCTPGATWKISCNHCKCSDDGTNYMCTKMFCPMDRECTPGETFKRDCNTCTCTSDGKVGDCTEMACVFQSITECTPGVSFKRDCNECTCTSEGKIGHCTERMCVKPPDTQCTPGQPYKRDCNICTCTSEGKIGHCTERMCVRPTENEQQSTTEGIEDIYGLASTHLTKNTDKA